jgi:hypothetical protein
MLTRSRRSAEKNKVLQPPALYVLRSPPPTSLLGSVDSILGLLAKIKSFGVGSLVFLPIRFSRCYCDWFREKEKSDLACPIQMIHLSTFCHIPLVAHTPLHFSVVKKLLFGVVITSLPENEFPAIN